MICLDNTDTLEGGASVASVVDYTVHGVVTGFAQLAAGQLSDTDPSVLYTAGAATSIVSITLVNTHSAAVTVNLYIDPGNGGNPRRLIPEDMSLGIGYSAVFDGQRLMVFNTNGERQITIPTATSTSAGIIEIATDAEAAAKTDTNRALVPSNVDSIGLIDAGDAAGWDFTHTGTDFTIDGNWHDLDLSSIVPAGAKFVYLTGWCQNNTVAQYFQVRKNGNSNVFIKGTQTIIVANAVHDIEMRVACDTNRYIEYRASNGGTWSEIAIAVSGWVL